MLFFFALLEGERPHLPLVTGGLEAGVRCLWVQCDLNCIERETPEKVLVKQKETYLELFKFAPIGGLTCYVGLSWKHIINLQLPLVTADSTETTRSLLSLCS